MNRLLDAAAYQGVWFAAVIGAGRGTPWPGVVAAVAFTALHLLDGQRAVKLALMLAGLGFGLLLDGGLAHAGWLRHAAADPQWRALVGAPAWILALWVVFPLTLTASLSMLQRRPVLAVAIGAIGGPLAYLGASRGMGAIEFTAPLLDVLAVLAVGWAIALGVLSRMAATGCAPRLAADTQR